MDERPCETPMTCLNKSSGLSNRWRLTPMSPSMPNPMINRPKTVHYSPVTLFMALLISGSLWVNSLAAPSAATALVTRTQDLRHPNKKRYLHQIDQQLQDLERRIGGGGAPKR